MDLQTYKCAFMEGIGNLTNLNIPAGDAGVSTYLNLLLILSGIFYSFCLIPILHRERYVVSESVFPCQRLHNDVMACHCHDS